MQRYESDIFEWIDYNLNKLKFDHIFIIDNNDDDNPLVVYDERITIIPFHNDTNNIFGPKHNYLLSTTINKHIKPDYDYVGVCDIDEYFYFNEKNVHEYIDSLEQQGFNAAYILWESYQSGKKPFNNTGMVFNYYKDKSKQQFEGKVNDDEYSYGKSIFKLNKDYYIFTSSHYTLSGNEYLITKIEDINEACCRHYRIKSMFDYFIKYKYRSFEIAPIYKNNCENLWEVYKMYNNVDESDKQQFDKIFDFLKTIS